MKKTLILVIFLLYSPALLAQSSELNFVPDPGIRVEGEAMGGVYVDPDSGTVYLYTTSGPNVHLNISTDGLNFTREDINAHPNYRALKLKNGTYVLFRLSTVDTTVYLKSQVSTDGGMHFHNSDTTLFTFPANDSFWVSKHPLYSTAFYTADSGIMLIYLAGGSVDNARSIFSPAGSNLKFSDYRTNIFGDSTLGSSYTYVDPAGILLPDGRLRVITMNQHGPPYPPAARKGVIYTFTSKDSGKTWTKDSGYRLRYDSFKEFEVYSLNDPKLVRLPDGKYRIYVAAMIKDDSTGTFSYSIISATSADTTTAVKEEKNDINKGFVLFPNEPNPFNPGTIIKYKIPFANNVELTIYDLLGRKIRTLVNELKSPGSYSAYWDGKNSSGEPVSSGVYLYKLASGNFVKIKKMMLLK